MKKHFVSLLCLALALVLALPACAEPVLSSTAGYTAYLGENNFLYLTDPEDNTKVLQTPIANLLGMTEEFLYCATADGRRFEVRLDGTSSAVVEGELTLEAPFTLVDGVLTIPGAGGAVIPNVLTACAADSLVYYVIANTFGSYTLMAESISLPEGSVSAPITIFILTGKPVSMTASADAIVIVTEDHRADIIQRTPNTGKESVPLAEEATHAFFFNNKLVSLVQDELGNYTVLSAVDHYPIDPASLLTPVPTSAPTATPRSTATPKPAATAKPAEDEDDGRISKGDTGSAVRKMQRRLSQLGYPVGAVDGDFGDNTLLAVNLFQCAIGYRNRTYASAKMLEKLYARNAPAYDPYAPLREGDEGADVRIMQQTLLDLGYDVGVKGADGKFGPDTKAAVEQFQFIAGLEVTGEADVETLKKLYDIEDPVPNMTASPVPSPSPTPEPTEEPTEEPTDAPTATPTAEPTDAPTATPTAEPTDAPTATPTAEPTDAPTEEPTAEPTEAPTNEPTANPGDESTATDLT